MRRFKFPGFRAGSKVLPESVEETNSAEDSIIYRL
jgi:hypothetical protein